MCSLIAHWVSQGEWWRGARQGWGRMVYANGDYYEGEWEAGLRQGEGVLVYANGNVYEGQWEGDNKEGKGRFSHASGVIQVFLAYQHHPFQDGFWVAFAGSWDCKRWSWVAQDHVACLRRPQIGGRGDRDGKAHVYESLLLTSAGLPI